MAVTLDAYAPFDSGAGANAMEATWRSMMRRNVLTGVIAGVTNELLTFGDSTGMQVKVNTGECWIEGHWGQNTAIKTLPVATAHATLARIDRAVARCDFVNNRIEVDVVTGTAAASPVAPSLTQNTSVWEISLALVSVAAAASTITAANVTDMRTWGVPHGRYQATSGATITVGTGGLKIPFAVAEQNTADVSPNTAGEIFTLNRAGVWVISTGLRWSSASAGFRIVHIADSTDTSIYQSDTLTYGGTAVTADHTMSTARRFPAGQTISIWAFTNTGTTTLDTAGALNVRTNLSLTRVGP